MKRLNLTRWGPILVVAASLTAGCVTPAPTASSVPSIQITSLPSHPDVLEACDTSLQAKAMRPSQVPNWERLPISACYDLTLDLDPDAKVYGGTARVTFANRAGVDLNDVVFRLYPNAPVIYGGELSLTSARIDGAAATPEVFLEDDTGLRLSFARPLPSGGATVIELAFDGRLPADFGAGRSYGIFNFASDGPVMALTNSFPILAAWRDGGWSASAVIGEGDAVVSEVALFRVRVAAPSEWTVVATGAPIEARTQGRSTRVEFVSGPARDFTVMASPAFTPRESAIDGVRVVHWGLPGGEARWDRELTIAAGSVGVFSDRFGPYPYAELDIVAVPLSGVSGVESPGLIVLNAGMYRNPSSLVSLDVTTAHEVAHQWWYGVVGSDALASPWQDEGLTTFSSLLYFEAHEPDFYHKAAASFKQSVAEFQADAGDEPIAQPLGAFQGRADAYGAIVYLKGALFFAALREQIGDEAFFDALKSYRLRGAYRLASPDELLDAFEEACACPLDGVYAEWGVVTGE